MKRILAFIFALFIAGTFSAGAQQLHQLTHYMVNPFVFNPAVAGSHGDEVVTRATFRKQWAGLERSPLTVVISAHGNLSPKRSIGLGGAIYNDVTGPTRRTGLQLAYAYHLPLVSNKIYLGLGVGGTLMQYGIDGDKLNAWQSNDPQLAAGKNTKFGGDANVGIHVSGEDFWAGVAVNQLAGSKFKVIGDEATVQDDRHAYLMGGYFININEKFGIEPSVLLKFVKGTKPSAEMAARFVYDKQYWLGVSYRTQDAVAILAGVKLNNGFNFTYAYDITTSNLNQFSNGSHELTLGFDFGVRRNKKVKKNDEVNPEIIE